jgi:penicillin-binding protein 2
MSYNNKEKNLRSSLRFLQLLVGLVFLLLAGRLIQLQVLEYDIYSPISERNSVRQETVNPSRGLITDRNGEILVSNEPVYNIYVTPSDFKRENTVLLAQITGIPLEIVERQLQEAIRYSWHRSSRLFAEVEFDMFSRIEENIWRLPGITHQIESKRVYPAGIFASHTLGYLREVTGEEFRQSNIYRLGDKAGRSGLEFSYEGYLRGETGTQFRRVNAYGQGIGPFNDGDFDIVPIKGANITTTLDADLQRLAELLMRGKTGGLVALDPNNGEILAMVSSPDFDISRLSGRLDRNYWAELNNNPDRPLFNRAIGSREPPGSTFKPVMGLIGLQLGLVTPETNIFCGGSYWRGRHYRCTAIHGNQNLAQAIKNSCNTYFFSMMNRLVGQFGINAWHRMIQPMGLGQVNQLDIPFESSGILPDSTQLDNIFGRRRWGLGDQINLGVGQGAMSVSPLQMALVTAEIANGGYWVQPHLVKAIELENGEFEYPTPQRKKIDWIQDRHLQVVREGMRLAVTEGSGRFYANLRSVPTAGKTGTAQNPRGRDHGWFVAYAPYDNPQIAIAVIIENGGFGSVSAAPIASLVIEQYITGAISRPRLVQDMLNFVPRDSNVQR